ncbi:uncharacterized protein LOC110849378 [Folsomia candida]|uniref:uncharacterized protein LOC110849378 n=1 Tax=Folsomia candida TaxID=158441 RepID=UPI000B907F08|nr:uncharacterized protein LOC110849378 [Folsomia candida]
MEKLIRVSNLYRGKKLIISTADLETFLQKVREKFSLDPDLEISFEDDQGAEIDNEVFPILLQQIATPNIIFRTKDEEISSVDISHNTSGNSQIFYVPSPLCSSAPPSPEPPVLFPVSEVDFFKQVKYRTTKITQLVYKLCTTICSHN